MKIRKNDTVLVITGKDRGKKGYDLTERLFIMLREQFPELKLSGPERAGKDVLLGSIFENYTKPDRPIDFLICDGSAVPANPGVNPSLTIAALAEYAMDLIPPREGSQVREPLMK